MRGERLESIEPLVRQVLPQVLPCPRSMVLDALQMLALEFCKETGAWEAAFEDTVCPHDVCISLPLPRGAGLADVVSVCLDGEKLTSGYEVAGRDIILAEAPARSVTAVVKATLRPLRTSYELPEDIIEEYGDIIAFGAIAKVKAMSGKNIEWTDPAGVQIYYQLYQEGCGKAKARKFRKRLGASMLFVNTEDVM